MLSILLGAVALLVGIGQKTFWAPPEIATATLAVPLEGAPVTVIEPGVASVPGSPVDIAIDAEGEFTLSLGRSADVEAWVGSAAHNTVSGVDAEQGTLLAEHTPGDATVPNPRDSDLWVATQSAEGHLVHQWTEPAEGEWSLLVAADGTQPAPTAVTVSWPNDASTPFAIPLMILGALLLIFGLAVAAGMRRGGAGGGSGSAAGRGRAGSAPAPAGGRGFEETAFGGPPAGPAGTAGEKPAGEGPHGRNEPPVARRAATRLAAAAAAGLLAALPALPAQAATTPAPSSGPASESAPPADSYPVLLEAQLERILESVVAAVEEGDKAKDAGKLGDRVGGKALELRQANYALQAKGADIGAPVALAAAPVRSAAVTTSTEWPRTAMAVTWVENARVPQVLVLRQDSARANYKLVSSPSVLPGSSFPGIAVGDTSVSTLPLDSKLSRTPKEAAQAVADYLSDGNSEAKDRVQENVFISSMHTAQDELKNANQNATIKFSRTVDEGQTVALSTPDGGALVATYVTSTVTSTPKEEGGTVELDDLSAASAGEDSTTKGVDVVYGEPMVLYVPASGSQDKISLLAADDVFLSAKLK
ncbi:hypothetical protein NCCP1664_26650 [Zafaria cholistanensis]|uniref:DUF8094 domain-containing protein n=1 Tax=Zafaria cholistanensis TaxID=1682741 RepID=A0A5A7NTG3_9MICC|nr:hypothetical protein NCCP1664_26650 [Zafaria cholistanensis]